MITIPSKVLKEKLKMAQLLCKDNQSVCLRTTLESENDVFLSLCANDSENTFTANIPVESMDHLSGVVPFAQFMKIASNAPADEISISLSDNLFTFESGLSIFTLPGLSDPDAFPAVEFLEHLPWFSINSAAFAQAIEFTCKPTLSKDWRAHIAGLKVSTEKDGLVFIATDGSRSHRYCLPRFESLPDVYALPAKKGMIAALPLVLSADSVDVAFSAKEVFIKAADDIFKIRCLEGEFPNVEPIFHQARSSDLILLDAPTAQQAFKRLLLFGYKDGITVNSRMDSFVFLSKVPSDGSVQESLPLGDPPIPIINLVLDPKFVQDALSCAYDAVTFGYQANDKAVYLACGAMEAVIMPMKY